MTVEALPGLDDGRMAADAHRRLLATTIGSPIYETHRVVSSDGGGGGGCGGGGCGGGGCGGGGGF